MPRRVKYVNKNIGKDSVIRSFKSESQKSFTKKIGTELLLCDDSKDKSIRNIEHDGEQENNEPSDMTNELVAASKRESECTNENITRIKKQRKTNNSKIDFKNRDAAKDASDKKTEKLESVNESLVKDTISENIFQETNKVSSHETFDNVVPDLDELLPHGHNSKFSTTFSQKQIDSMGESNSVVEKKFFKSKCKNKSSSEETKPNCKSNDYSVYDNIDDDDQQQHNNIRTRQNTYHHQHYSQFNNNGFHHHNRTFFQHPDEIVKQNEQECDGNVAKRSDVELGNNSKAIKEAPIKSDDTIPNRLKKIPSHVPAVKRKNCPRERVDKDQSLKSNDLDFDVFLPIESKTILDQISTVISDDCEEFETSNNEDVNGNVIEEKNRILNKKLPIDKPIKLTDYSNLSELPEDESNEISNKTQKKSLIKCTKSKGCSKAMAVKRLIDNFPNSKTLNKQQHLLQSNLRKSKSENDRLPEIPLAEQENTINRSKQLVESVSTKSGVKRKLSTKKPNTSVGNDNYNRKVNSSFSLAIDGDSSSKLCTEIADDANHHFADDDNDENRKNICAIKKIRTIDSISDNKSPTKCDEQQTSTDEALSSGEENAKKSLIVKKSFTTENCLRTRVATTTSTENDEKLSAVKNINDEMKKIVKPFNRLKSISSGNLLSLTFDETDSSDDDSPAQEKLARRLLRQEVRKNTILNRNPGHHRSRSASTSRIPPNYGPTIIVIFDKNDADDSRRLKSIIKRPRTNSEQDGISAADVKTAKKNVGFNVIVNEIIFVILGDRQGPDGKPICKICCNKKHPNYKNHYHHIVNEIKLLYEEDKSDSDESNDNAVIDNNNLSVGQDDLDRDNGQDDLDRDNRVTSSAEKNQHVVDEMSVPSVNKGALSNDENIQQKIAPCEDVCAKTTSTNEVSVSKTFKNDQPTNVVKTADKPIHKNNTRPHRMASLNALAVMQCLYDNDNKGISRRERKDEESFRTEDRDNDNNEKEKQKTDDDNNHMLERYSEAMQRTRCGVNDGKMDSKVQSDLIKEINHEKTEDSQVELSRVDNKDICEQKSESEEISPIEDNEIVANCNQKNARDNTVRRKNKSVVRDSIKDSREKKNISDDAKSDRVVRKKESIETAKKICEIDRNNIEDNSETVDETVESDGGKKIVKRRFQSSKKYLSSKEEKNTDNEQREECVKETFKCNNETVHSDARVKKMSKIDRLKNEKSLKKCISKQCSSSTKRIIRETDSENDHINDSRKSDEKNANSEDNISKNDGKKRRKQKRINRRTNSKSKQEQTIKKRDQNDISESCDSDERDSSEYDEESAFGKKKRQTGFIRKNRQISSKKSNSSQFFNTDQSSSSEFEDDDIDRINTRSTGKTNNLNRDTERYSRSNRAVRSVGQYWDFESMPSSSSSSSSSDSEVDSESTKVAKKQRTKRLQKNVTDSKRTNTLLENPNNDKSDFSSPTISCLPLPRSTSPSSLPTETERNTTADNLNLSQSEKNRKKRKLNLPLKDMSSSRRMASANAAAILKATYESLPIKRNTPTTKTKNTNLHRGKKERANRIQQDIYPLKKRKQSKIYGGQRSGSSSHSDNYDIDDEPDADVEDTAAATGTEENLLLKATSDQLKEFQQCSKVVTESIDQSHCISLIDDDDDDDDDDKGSLVIIEDAELTNDSTIAVGDANNSKSCSNDFDNTNGNHRAEDKKHYELEPPIFTAKDCRPMNLTSSLSSSYGSNSASRASSSMTSVRKSYAPLIALSSMQPPDASSQHHQNYYSKSRQHHRNHHHHLHYVNGGVKTHASLRDSPTLNRHHGSSSAFSAPERLHLTSPRSLSESVLRSSSSPHEPLYVAGVNGGYFQPAGPLISSQYSYHHGSIGGGGGGGSGFHLIRNDSSISSGTTVNDCSVIDAIGSSCASVDSSFSRLHVVPTTIVHPPSPSLYAGSSGSSTIAKAIQPCRAATAAAGSSDEAESIINGTCSNGASSVSSIGSSCSSFERNNNNNNNNTNNSTPDSGYHRGFHSTPDSGYRGFHSTPDSGYHRGFRSTPDSGYHRGFRSYRSSARSPDSSAIRSPLNRSIFAASPTREGFAPIRSVSYQPMQRCSSFDSHGHLIPLVERVVPIVPAPHRRLPIDLSTTSTSERSVIIDHQQQFLIRTRSRSPSSTILEAYTAATSSASNTSTNRPLESIPIDYHHHHHRPPIQTLQHSFEPIVASDHHLYAGCSPATLLSPPLSSPHAALAYPATNFNSPQLLYVRLAQEIYQQQSLNSISAVENATPIQLFSAMRQLIQENNMDSSSASSSSTSSKASSSVNKTKTKSRPSQPKKHHTLSSNHGWHWVGEPFMARVFLNADDIVLRKCYRAMEHEEGDIICQRDCVLIKSSKRKSNLPHVAKIAHLWEDNDRGDMMLSVHWYYRPQHVYKNKKNIHAQELYASKHKDVTYAACIEDKCFVLSFNEYARFRKELKKIAESVLPTTRVVPPLPVPTVAESEKIFCHQRVPSTDVAPELVFFCYQLYDFIHNRTVRKPKFEL